MGVFENEEWVYSKMKNSFYARFENETKEPKNLELCSEKPETPFKNVGLRYEKRDS